MNHPAKRKRNANVAICSSVLPWFVSKVNTLLHHECFYDEEDNHYYWRPETSDDDLAQQISSAVAGSPSLVDFDRGYEPAEFAIRYLRQELLSKFDDGKPSPAKTQVTWERFYEAEEACLKANARLSHPPLLSYTTGVGVWSYIDTARRKIGWLLGEYSDEKVARGMSFTSGASFHTKRVHGDSAYKFSGPPETTVDNLPTAMDQICSSDLWLRTAERGEYIHLAPGNRLCCVPKNYKTDRMIAIEPSMNMYVQKGLGSYIRHRLLRVGIDLNDQKPNQEMALQGSLHGGLATIDLSMASDTISQEIVRQLLPPDWLRALEQCRSPMGVLPSGKKVLYRKFSSMGNGYTFELESMIFWALAWAVTYLHDGDIPSLRVYGDDIVVDDKVALPLMDLLSFCGFKTNKSKTFVDGQFRESCGKHYWRGCDVTPFYVRRPVSNLAELFKLHNKFYRWVARVRGFVSSDFLDECYTILRSLRDRAPAGWRRPRIPDGFGDGAFIGSFEECLPSKPAGSVRKTAGWEGWYVEVLAETTKEGIPIDDRLYCPQEKKFSRRKVWPRIGEGYLLSLLCRPRPSAWYDHLYPREVLGGLSLGLRTRIITILVTQWEPL